MSAESGDIYEHIRGIRVHGAFICGSTRKHLSGLGKRRAQV